MTNKNQRNSMCWNLNMPGKNKCLVKVLNVFREVLTKTKNRLRCSKNLLKNKSCMAQNHTLYCKK